MKAMREKAKKTKPAPAPARRTIVAGAAALAVFYLLLNWNTFTAPFERDEGEYAYAAWITLQGQVPYISSFLHKPPLTIFMYMLGYFIDPAAVWP
ncbi:MAG: hypothetical protein PHW69_10050, partial [Elusimicrobiaceae bacterium]|nr:hypothetical protein [Elusimicrobiaceae bacterium]